MSIPHRGLTALPAIGAAIAALTGTITTAAAMPAPAPDGGGAVPDHPVPPAPPVYSISHGSPLWVFVVVALATALITLAAVYATARLRQPRHPRTAPA
jgi:hypothetical protein